MKATGRGTGPAVTVRLRTSQAARTSRAQARPRSDPLVDGADARRLARGRGATVLRLPSTNRRARRATRALIIARHRLFAEALRTILEADGIEIVGLTSNAKDAMGLMRGGSLDLVIVDFDLPDRQAMQVTEAMQSEGLPGKLVALGERNSPEGEKEAVGTGVTAFISKDISPSGFIEAVRAALRAEAPGAAVRGRRRGQRGND